VAGAFEGWVSVGFVRMVERPSFSSDSVNPLQLPTVRRPRGRIIGDRRPGYRYCSCCAATLDGAPVVRGMWAYCSIECALKMEREDAEETA
jgi:hypothetical protein